MTGIGLTSVVLEEPDSLVVTLMVFDMADAQPRTEYVILLDIEDIIGPRQQWPHYIRPLFWTSSLRYFQR